MRDEYSELSGSFAEACRTTDATVHRTNGSFHDAPYDDAPPVTSLEDYGSGEPIGVAETVTPLKLSLLNASALAGKEVPPRRWLVPHRIPLGVPSILSGDGAAGKTTIALQLSVATLLGTDWLGAVIDEPGPVIFFTAEEDLDEIHRRLDAIATHSGIGLDKLGNLHLLCMPGEDSVLGVADKSDRVRPTPLFEALEAAACDVRPVLIVIEAAADVFAVNESNRSQVRQSVGLLRRLGNKTGAAVLLIQHPSLTGMQSNTGTSGSTHWNNAARSRLYFSNPPGGKDQNGDESDSDVRELRVMKANYGPKGERVRLRWQRGVFVPEGSASTPQRLAAEAEVDGVFLRCLEVRTAQGLTVGAQTGRNYAPAEFAKMPEANGLKNGAFALAMERLLSAGGIIVETGGPPSKPTRRLVRR
jgi:RecA-family ATPase